MRSSISTAVTGQAALGTLYIKPILKEPRRVYYGPEDVHGKVLLRYVPPSRSLSTSTGNPGLFGPLHVDVTLKGIVRVNHDDESRADITHLFTESVKIHDGAFRAVHEVEHTYPFTLTFPEHAQLKTYGAVAAVQDESGRWNFRSQSQNVDVVPLPPSMESKVQDATAVSMIYAMLRTVAAVQYTFSVQARMPGIDVDIIIANANKDEVLLYDLPKVPVTIATNTFMGGTEFTQQLSLQNDSLRTSEERPHGFMGKTKALLRSSGPPTFVFIATVSGIPQHAFVGQPIAFNLSIATHDSSTAKVIPEVYLDSCTVTLIAHTRGVQPTNIEIIRSKEAGFSHKQHPFSDQYGWSRTIDVGVLSWVPSTFTFGDVGRSYKLRIASQFAVGKEKLQTRRDVAVTIHPPLLLDDAASPPPPEFGLTRVNSGGSAVLPGYEEAMAATLSQPSYEDATAGQSHPSYEQAVSDTLHQPSYDDATAGHSHPSYEEAVSNTLHPHSGITADVLHDVSTMPNSTNPSASVHSGD